MLIKYCELCGKKYETKNEDQKYCSRECGYTASAQLRTKRKKEKQVRESLEALYRDIEKAEQYNKEHGTHLSYGQYMAKRYPILERRPK